MMRKIKAFLFVLSAFVLSACNNRIEEDISYVEYDKNGEDDVVLEVEHTIDNEHGVC